MEIRIINQYCPDCCQKENHLYIIQKADETGYNYVVRILCLSPYCNHKETKIMPYPQVIKYLGGNDEKEE